MNRDNAPTTPARVDDNEFIRQAYQSGVLETKLAHVAVENSQDKDVQTMGHRIINEQGRATDELKKLAGTKSITLDAQLTSSSQQTYDRLAKLKGAEFDSAYREHLKSDYKQTIQLYEQAAGSAQDSGVRDVATRFATLFEEHATVIGITGLGSTDNRTYVRESDSSARATGPLSQKDQQLVAKLHRLNRTEMEAARLAAKNSRDRQVQTLAQNLLTEHKQMEQDLRDLASRRNVDLPRQLGEGQQDRVDKLKDLSGDNFDKEYQEYVNQSHRNLKQLFDDATASSDSDLRAFAQKYREGIERHMQSQRQNVRSNK